MSLVPDAEGQQWEAHFVQNMAQRRKELGMTQAVLARHLSAQGLAFHQQTVQRIENGERPVRLNEAVLIVQALGLGEPGKLGLDSAISPQLSGAIARLLLETAVVRVEPLMSAAELGRTTAFDRVGEAIFGVRRALDAYLAALGTNDERDDFLIADARAELDFLERYLTGLIVLAGLQPGEAGSDGEHSEEA